jgi:Bifunctional DNA primase/polymerase, N-terminal.
MKPFFESRYIDPASNRISHIISLLGPALLLPWPAGCKGSRKKWKHLQLTDMSAPGHLAELESAGNIGVALGRVSNGLVTLDFDDEDYVERFLEVNPLLRTTLRTTAQRGCNIWLRCTTDYPRSSKLTNRSGEEIGEWRADGNQTIVAGTHPSGMPYRFVVEKPAIAIDYSEIVWPDVISPPDATESKRVRRVIEKEVVSVSVSDGGLQIQASFGVDVIAQVAPTDYHQNNTSLFRLARLVKSYEKAIGRLATVLERQFVL